MKGVRGVAGLRTRSDWEESSYSEVDPSDPSLQGRSSRKRSNPRPRRYYPPINPLQKTNFTRTLHHKTLSPSPRILNGHPTDFSLLRLRKINLETHYF